MRPTYSVHVVWHYFVLEPSTSFFLVLWSMLWPYCQMWLMWLITSNPNPRILKIEKMKNKWKRKSKWKKNKKKPSLLSVILTSGCTHMGIDEQLVKEKRIQKRPINFLFEVFNADGTKDREVIRVALLEIKINGYKKQLKAVVTNLNGTDMILGHNWLVKHNLEVNWKNGMIKFTRCLGSCTIKH